MERSNRCFIALVILATIAASACRDTTGPSGTAEFTGTVSEPVVMAAQLAAVGGPHVMSAGATDPVAFISLTPGNAPDATSATITNLRSDQVITTAIVDGGFDPVGIPALAGDTLDVAITISGGGVAHAKAAVPERKAPRVVRTRPATRRTDVALNSVIAVVFSEPIDRATLTEPAVRLLAGGTAVAGQWQVAGDDGIAIQFAPAEPLRPATTYQLVVGTGLADLAGEVLEEGVTAEFTTSSSTGTITVPPEGSRLVFTGQPTDVTVLTPFAPPVTVKLIDALGATFTNFAGTVALELDQASGETGIFGVTQVIAVGGVATFTNVAVSPAGTGYTLSAVADPAARVTSEPFEVLPSPWVPKPYVSGRRMGAATAVAGGRFYFIGGFNDQVDDFIAEDRVEVFDPVTSIWSAAAPLPFGRIGAAAAELGGLIYVAGGASDVGGSCATPPTIICAAPLATLHTYDPATDIWTERAPMPTARLDAAAAVINGKLYVFGGRDQSGALQTVEAYDPATNSWSASSLMPYGRWNLAATSLDGMVYVVGGFGPEPMARVEVYFPEIDAWTTARATLLSPRAGAGGAAVGGLLYSVGGWGGSHPLGEGALADLDAYDPASDTWMRAPSLPIPGSTNTGVVDGVIYAVVDGQYFYAFEP